MARIAIEYTSALQGAGIGRSIRHLTNALLQQLEPAHDYLLWAASRQNTVSPSHPRAALVRTPIDSIWLTRLWHRAHIPLPVEWLCGRCDIFFATDFALPPTRTAKTVLLIHDLSYLRVPDAAHPALKAYLSQVVPASLKRTARVVVNSQATRLDVMEQYHLDETKVTPITFGVSPEFYRDESPLSVITHRLAALQRPYLLTVGTVQPRKNYIRLIESLSRLRASGFDIDLVIVGSKGWLSEPIYRAANSPNVASHVHMLDHILDDELRLLYSHTACFVMPSLYEGFGLPLLEAMACGAPVVTSDISSMPEVAGDAALLCNPYDVDSITHAIKQMLSDTTLRDNYIERGYKRVANYTWEAGARDLLDVFQGLLT